MASLFLSKNPLGCLYVILDSCPKIGVPEKAAAFLSQREPDGFGQHDNTTVNASDSDKKKSDSWGSTSVAHFLRLERLGILDRRLDRLLHWRRAGGVGAAGRGVCFGEAEGTTECPVGLHSRVSYTCILYTYVCAKGTWGQHLGRAHALFLVQRVREAERQEPAGAGDEREGC